MKILLAYCASVAEKAEIQRIIAVAPSAVTVSGFCLNLPRPLRRRLQWSELDSLWRRRDRRLLDMYEELARAAEGYDALVLYNGRNLHPGFLSQLGLFSVFCCFDDPESSAKISRPIAASFDAALFGNVAARFQYRAWGCRRMAFQPIFVLPPDLRPPEDLQNQTVDQRDNDIILCCALTRWRKQRLLQLTGAFPQAKCFGQGWGNGWISDKELADLYWRSRIGWNIHNSTGPINKRTFALAAYGVLQICDNALGLAHVYELGREAVGFHTVHEAIKATRYYLHRPEETRRIAVAGNRRFWRDYHPSVLWSKLAERIRNWMAECQPHGDPEVAELHHGSRTTRARCHSFRFSARKSYRVDERFYCGVSPSFPFRGFGWHVSRWISRRGYGGEVAPTQLVVIAWAAATILTESGNRIHEIGGSPLRQLLRRIPGICIDSVPVKDFSEKLAKVPTTSDTVAAVLPFLEGTLDAQAVPLLRTYAPRAVVCVRTTRGGLDILPALEECFGQVKLFGLVSSYVPWLHCYCPGHRLPEIVLAQAGPCPQGPLETRETPEVSIPSQT